MSDGVRSPPIWCSSSATRAIAGAALVLELGHRGDRRALLAARGVESGSAAAFGVNRDANAVPSVGSAEFHAPVRLRRNDGLVDAPPTPSSPTLLVDDGTLHDDIREVTHTNDGAVSDEDHHVPHQRPRAVSLSFCGLAAVADDISWRGGGPIHVREVARQPVGPAHSTRRDRRRAASPTALSARWLAASWWWPPIAGARSRRAPSHSTSQARCYVLATPTLTSGVMARPQLGARPTEKELDQLIGCS